MILQSLCAFYDRKIGENPHALPAYGFALQEIPFVVVIDKSGRFVQFEDTRQQQGKKLKGQSFLLPNAEVRSSGIAPNLMWDGLDYALGIDIKNNPQRTQEQFNAFYQRIKTDLAAAKNDEGFVALQSFFAHVPYEQISADVLWPEIIKTKPNLTFRLAGESGVLFHRPTILQAYQQQVLQSESHAESLCLVSGQVQPVAVLHPKIKGVWGATTSGANMVSFNNAAFTSWQKEQGANAPVGALSSFKYGTALNYLLRSDNASRFQLGETSVVCWGAEPTALETILPLLISDTPQDDPEAGASAIKAFMTSLHNGAYVQPDAHVAFHVLGLAPNVARISVRFWAKRTVAEFAQNLSQWFADIAIESGKPEDYPGLRKLLRSVALEYKDDTLPQNLVGDTAAAVLSGQPLPRVLLYAVLRRIRVAEESITPNRARLLKAYLNRYYRSIYQPEKEVGMSLNPEDTRIAYCLGRLFAALEKLQDDAGNSTLRERYFSGACATPGSVFGRLLRLSTHHLAKLDHESWKIAHEKRIGEILQHCSDIPRHLNPLDQGLFAIGYYHQKNAFYKKSEQGETL